MSKVEKLRLLLKELLALPGKISDDWLLYLITHKDIPSVIQKDLWEKIEDRWKSNTFCLSRLIQAKHIPKTIKSTAAELLKPRYQPFFSKYRCYDSGFDFLMRTKFILLEEHVPEDIKMSLWKVCQEMRKGFLEEPSPVWRSSVTWADAVLDSEALFSLIVGTHVPDQIKEEAGQLHPVGALIYKMVTIS